MSLAHRACEEASAENCCLPDVSPYDSCIARGGIYDLVWFECGGECARVTRSRLCFAKLTILVKLSAPTASDS